MFLRFGLQKRDTIIGCWRAQLIPQVPVNHENTFKQRN